MKLNDIIKNLDEIQKIEGDSSVEIKGLSCDSKKVKDGYLFIAVKGARLNGADFIDEAIDRGAKAILLESEKVKKLTSVKDVTFVYAKNATLSLSQAARNFYGDISSNMRLIGVTGTNGKTTITYLLESLFKIKNESVGVIGTINYRFGNRLIPSSNTTPGILDLYSFLGSMNREDIFNCILEVSSHSLEQGRVDSLNFDIAVFTNLTNEHLDYHKNMDNYLLSKMKLFEKIKTSGFAVINKDDPYSGRIIEKLKSKKDITLLTYGIKEDLDVFAKDIKFSFEGLKFKLCFKGGQNIEINSSLMGLYNVYNILAGACCGIAMGMTPDNIKSGIEDIKNLPGRLEKVDCGQDFLVFVDYAHTENGLENVLKALKDLKPKRIFTVFGCGGDRDKSKRPNMGKIASELSDKIFITSDNPRNEEPMDIINDIKKGINPEKNNYVIEIDRFRAISEALEEAKKGDIVLVSGKGHETYQVFKNVTVPFDDRLAVRKILQGEKPCLQSETL